MRKFKMKNGLALIVFIIATTACAKNGHPKNKGQKIMTKITLTNKLVKRFTIKGYGDYEITVGYILKKDTYKNKKGVKREGPVASLLIPDHVHGHKPRIVDVGTGSIFKVGKLVFNVLEVTPGPSGEGQVVLQPAF